MSESSVFGGVLTLIGALVFLSFSIVTLYNIFQKQKYNLDITTKSIIIELTFGFLPTGKYYCDF